MRNRGGGDPFIARSFKWTFNFILPDSRPKSRLDQVECVCGGHASPKKGVRKHKFCLFTSHEPSTAPVAGQPENLVLESGKKSSRIISNVQWGLQLFFALSTFDCWSLLSNADSFRHRCRWIFHVKVLWGFSSASEDLPDTRRARKLSRRWKALRRRERENSLPLGWERVKASTGLPRTLDEAKNTFSSELTMR